ncbi:hypothetical protein [Rheinheimera hassiensis]|uniref:hypothetical protein n=1 Tax=Rheinheimera hassiensis TaxID=1193627 RepID=UPI001F062636|nr:hypothetical protein [Rheinheimera hassiensis]
MKKLTTILILSAAAALAGCASTDNSAPDGSFKVLSNKPYVWDNSISEALNVAKMAQPAGVGGGMRDFEDGMQANEGKSSGAMRVFDAVTSGLAMGVYGVASSETLGSAAEQHLNWRTSIVELYPVPNENVSTSELIHKVSKFVGEKTIDAIGKEYADLKSFGVFEPRNSKSNFNSAVLFYSENACKDSLRYTAYNKSNAITKITQPLKKFFQTEIDDVGGYCGVFQRVEIAGLINQNGRDHYVVVAEIQSGNFFDKAIIENYDGYVLVPSSLEVKATDKPVTFTVTRPYSFVAKSSNILLFEKKKG